MKFSILISSYNKGKYLESCIESCLNQTEENYEIILFDNNSTDNTDELLDKYSSKVKIVKKERISEHPAINQVDLIFNAFEVSTGSIICLLDADDYFSHNKLETIKNFFIRHSNVNTVFDLPILKYSDYQSKFILKKKIQKNIWPTIIPTSGISCSREFFYFFIKNSFAKTYKMLEIDFRLNVLSRIIDTNYEICEDDLTYYRQIDTGLMSNINKFSKKWWNKRYEAHDFMNSLFKKHNRIYNNKIDYFISKFISNFNNKN